MKKPGVFYFTFSHELNGHDYEETMGFNISPEGVEILSPKLEDDSIGDICRPIEEEFGVHDWCSAPTEEVEAIGYTTYEIDTETVPTVMDRWHKELENLVGKDNLTSWVPVTGFNASMNDTEIHETIRQVIEAISVADESCK